MLSRIDALVLVSLAICGCGGAGDGPAVRLDFRRQGSLYDAPFPSDDLRGPDGRIDLSRYPNPDHVAIVDQALALLKQDARGFAVSGGIFFALSGDLGNVALPDLAGSVAADSPVFVMDLGARTRHPLRISYNADGGPFGAANLLTLLPLQGMPLAANTTYAAVVRRSLHDAMGRPVAPSVPIASLSALPGYGAALSTLAAAGVPAADIAGLAVFTTDDPTAAMQVFRQDVLSRELPVPEAFTPGEVFGDYCVYNSALDMPDYQQGAAPYSHSGGNWAVDAAGHPLPPHTERARLVVTVPRTPMPPGGYPTVVLVRTGAGGDRPLVDRGVQGTNGGPPLVPGSGPAQEYARVGWAGVQVDGPLGGLRNASGANEDYLIFNVLNLAALRDNVRESALELALLAHVVPALKIDASGCPGSTAQARFDGGHLALMGHSMGATIAPLALASEPLYQGLVLSGAGGSYIENILWKRKPVEVLPLAEALLGYGQINRSLEEGDAVLSLAQWATEPADPQVYAAQIIRQPRPGMAPRPVLMEQGIVDNYILPNIADALSVPLGLDLGGAELDRGNPRLQMQVPVTDLLPLAGRGAIALPAGGNVSVGGTKITAILAQHPEDGIEDGHEVVFQTEPPKHQYRCFLAGLVRGPAPLIPADGPADAPCP